MTLKESFVGYVRRRMNAQGCFPQLAALGRGEPVKLVID